VQQAATAVVACCLRWHQVYDYATCDDAHGLEALNAAGISALFIITTHLPLHKTVPCLAVQQRIAVEDDDDTKQMRKLISLPQLMLDIQHCIDGGRQVLTL
jgi:hypothetical protein